MYLYMQTVCLIWTLWYTLKIISQNFNLTLIFLSDIHHNLAILIMVLFIKQRSIKSIDPSIHQPPPPLFF